MDVDRPRIAVLGAAPEGFQQGLARETCPGSAASVRRSSNSRYVSCTGSPETSTVRFGRSIRTPSTSMASLRAPAGGVGARRSRADTAPESPIENGFVM